MNIQGTKKCFFYVQNERGEIMFKIDTNKNIYLTRGDVATINVTAKNSDGTDYVFKKDEVVRFNVFSKNACHDIVIRKDVVIEEETNVVNILLTSAETRFGELINKPVDYWYEIIINPDTAPQTIVGYLEYPTIFKLLPEGGSDL